MNTKIALEIKNVSKRYEIGKQKDSSLRGTLSGVFKSANSSKDEFWALKDISFTVNKGDVIGIIGKNGAGKSTLLKVLSQITKPSEGTIHIDGRIASLLEVGTGFHPELTGRENIYLNGTILGMTRNEVKEKFDEIVAFSGIEKFIDTPVKHYSSGMYVRLAFSVAAHLEPEILVIDEVLAVGDAEFQKKCLGKMQDVASHGRTVLFVSHHLGSVKQLCNKGILLEKGTLKFAGSIDDTIKMYQSGMEGNYAYSTSKNTSEIYLKNAGFKSSNNCYSFDEEIPIYFGLANISAIEKRDVRLLFRITNNEEQIIATQEVKIKTTIEVYHFSIPQSFLTKGHYFINIIIYNPGIEQIENIENVLSFEVLNNPSQFDHLETFNIGNIYLNENWTND